MSRGRSSRIITYRMEWACSTEKESLRTPISHQIFQYKHQIFTIYMVIQFSRATFIKAFTYNCSASAGIYYSIKRVLQWRIIVLLSISPPFSNRVLKP